MNMRDPGAAGRNPLFDRADYRWRPEAVPDAHEHTRTDDPPRDERDGAGESHRLPSFGASADILMTAVYEAGPEAAEHMLRGAQEFLLAAKAVVDAAERVVEQHRHPRSERSEAAPAEAPPAKPTRIRRIDLA
jgi:hypothetical protein